MASEVTQALTPNLSLEDVIQADMERLGLSRQEVLELHAQQQADAEQRFDDFLAEHPDA